MSRKTCLTSITQGRPLLTSRGHHIPERILTTLALCMPTSNKLTKLSGRPAPSGHRIASSNTKTLFTMQWITKHKLLIKYFSTNQLRIRLAHRSATSSGFLKRFLTLKPPHLTASPQATSHTESPRLNQGMRNIIRSLSLASLKRESALRSLDQISIPRWKKIRKSCHQATLASSSNQRYPFQTPNLWETSEAGIRVGIKSFHSWSTFRRTIPWTIMKLQRSKTLTRSPKAKHWVRYQTATCKEGIAPTPAFIEATVPLWARWLRSLRPLKVILSSNMMTS